MKVELMNGENVILGEIEDKAFKQRDVAKTYAFLIRQSNPETFLRWIRTRDIQDRLSDQMADAVRIMTIHAAKGLEWDHVFVVGCNEGILPSKRGDLEEERRLFYVAVTRARETLCLSHAAQREGYGGKVQQLDPSRFLEAAGVEVSS